MAVDICIWYRYVCIVYCSRDIEFKCVVIQANFSILVHVPLFTLDKIMVVFSLIPSDPSVEQIACELLFYITQYLPDPTSNPCTWQACAKGVRWGSRQGSWTHFTGIFKPEYDLIHSWLMLLLYSFSKRFQSVTFFLQICDNPVQLDAFNYFR